MNFNEAISYLNSLAIFGIRPGTERTSYAASLLGNPQDSYKTIHVAGTNGKGSTTTFISSILKNAGYNVGTYTSPYVFIPNERIQYNLEYISDNDFAYIINKIKILNEKLENTEYGVLTEFEAKTLATFLYFKIKKVDYAVIEVGMGGRFDATNIITPEVSVITSISLDHTEYLGNTIEEIAFEKAGIIKDNVPVISGANPTANKVISNIAKEKNSPFISVNSTNGDYIVIPKETSFDVKSKDIYLKDIKCTLTGKYQYYNATCAIAASRLLNIDDEFIYSGIKEAFLPGRFQRVSESPTIILDVAHNIDGAKALYDNLKNLKYKNLILVLGMLSNHDSDEFIKTLAPLTNIFIATKSTYFKATDEDIIYNNAKRHISNIYKRDSVMSAVEYAKELATNRDLILVTGSFYTIGEYKN